MADVLKPSGPLRTKTKRPNPGVAKGLGGNTQPPTSGSRAAPKRSVSTTPSKAPPPMGARKSKR